MNVFPLQKGVGVGAGKRFEIQEVIGQGTFGITYKAWDKRLKRQVALKESFPTGLCSRAEDGVRVAPADEAEYERAFAAMLDEALTLARLRHPGIVVIYDAFKEVATNSLFIAMEWLSGGSLEQRIRQGSVSYDDAANWLKVLLGALAEVHKNNITHRDIKPGNIVFNGLDQPVLVDFGSALNRDTKVGMTVQGPYTMAYAAPEQLFLQMGKVGPWTDFYALAATWYELLTGLSISASRGVALAEGRFGKTPLADSVMKNLEVVAGNRCQTADEWLAMLGSAIPQPELPEPDEDKEDENTEINHTEEDVYDLIRILRRLYPRDERGRLPKDMKRFLQKAESRVSAYKNRWLKILLVVAFLLLMVPFDGGLLLGLAGVIALIRRFVVPRKTKQQIIEETMHSISVKVKEQNHPFWWKNARLWRGIKD